ncbi:hypothetical protein [Ferroglobus sp.]|uniref:EMC6-like membrane protein n=1 Tax=Ferroglobus sp. TaxID=2614230 RepID=UPI0025C02436|nr:hypothetical protein [Ferroglobus sp.]
MKKTYLPILLGALAGVLSYLVTQDLRTRDAIGIVILMLFVYVHKIILPKFGEKIETKDWVAIFFLSLCSWYVSWTLLLNM